VVSDVVDRFLAAKRSGVPAVAAESAVSAPAAANLTPQAPLAPAAPLPIADFVCEEDVRRAVAQSKKIYIGPKTIVTPSARDLALRTDTLVLTEQRSSAR
jgi:hypothetical protein